MQPLRILVTAVLLLSVAPSPTLAAETGTIRGRVVNQTTGEAEPGVRVVLSGGTVGSSEADTLEQTTDRRGRYEFTDLPTGDDRFYAIDAFYQGGMFSGGALTLPSDTSEEPIVESSLRVWETSTDPSALTIARDAIFLTTNDEGGMGVVESVSITNAGDTAYIGRGAGAEDAEPGTVASVGFALPGRADNRSVSIVDADIDVPALISTEYGFAITAALPPGQTRFTFSYAVEGLTGSFDLSRRALYPIEALDVYAAPPLQVQSNRSSLDGTAEVGDQTYDRYSIGEPLDAGDSLQLIAVAEAGTPVGLFAGMAGVLLLVLFLGAFPFLRSRRRTAAEPRTREGLVRAIALLDIEHEESDLPTEEWASRRAGLKAELAEFDRKEAGRR